MTTIKNAWVIIQGDFRGNKLRLLWALLFSIVFMAYIAIFSSMAADDTLGSHEGALLTDFILIFTVPLIGFSFSRRSLKYLSEDSYTRMLAYMRCLPVPAAVILCKRKLQAVFSFCLNGVLFFGFLYAFGGNIRNELSVPLYLAFALTWIGYGLVVTGLYIFIEFSVSGKMYFLLTVIIMLLSMGGAVLIKLTGGNLFLYTIKCSQHWGLLSPLMWGTLLFGTVSVQLFSKWTIHRLKSRDLV